MGRFDPSTVLWRQTETEVQILPDQFWIALPHENGPTQYCTITGKVRIILQQPTTIKSSNLVLEGVSEVRLHHPGRATPTDTVRTTIFYYQQKRISPDRTYKFNAGMHEWPFEFRVTANVNESVEGLTGSSVRYYLVSETCFASWNTNHIVSKTPIHLIRTLDSERSLMANQLENTDIWSNKLAYTLTILRNLVFLGGSITMRLELVPFEKNLCFFSFKMQLIEIVDTCVNVKVTNKSNRLTETEIVSQYFDLTGSPDPMVRTGRVQGDETHDEALSFDVALCVPGTLTKCRLDADSSQIHIKHRLDCKLDIRNPDGHVSRVAWKAPIRVLLSSRALVHIQSMPDISHHTVSETVHESGIETASAPPYGKHNLDPICHDAAAIDTQGILDRQPGLPPSYSA